MKNKGVCYLIGAGTHYNNHTIMPDRDDYVIAVDGGIHYLASNNITPHLHLGDMDSLSKDPIPFHVDTITFPPQKDDTDMCLAAKEGF